MFIDPEPVPFAVPMSNLQPQLRMEFADLFAKKGI